jgi:hypothetical protein
MPGGRPPLGSALIDRFEAPELEKRRAKEILAVLSREKTVDAACRDLGVGRARFYQLQDEFIGSGIAGLAPKPPGRRPAPQPSEADLENLRLREELTEQKLLAHAAEIRAELAELLPGVLRRRGSGQKKTRKPW